MAQPYSRTRNGSNHHRVDRVGYYRRYHALYGKKDLEFEVRMGRLAYHPGADIDVWCHYSPVCRYVADSGLNFAMSIRLIVDSGTSWLWKTHATARSRSDHSLH